MGVKIVSGSQSTLLCCSNPNLQASKSMLKPSSYYNIGFSSSKSSLSNPSFSLKSRFESFRTIPQASLSSFYVSPDIYCDVLGVSVNSSLSEIKQAYRKLVRKYHPDVSPPELKEEHTKIIIQVQEAYETLCDLKARALYYDQVLTPGLHGQRPRRDKEIFRQFGLGEASKWKIRWESQLMELQRRGMNKLSNKQDMSWAARVRRQSGGRLGARKGRLH